MSIRLLTSLTLIFGSLSSAAACPDLSGVYLQTKDGTRGNFKKHSGWPLRNIDTTVEIKQAGCREITLSYPNTLYSNQPVESETISFIRADESAADETSISARFIEKSDGHEDAMLGMIKYTNIRRVDFRKTADGLTIQTKDVSRGWMNYVIPFHEVNRFEYHLIKKAP